MALTRRSLTQDEIMRLTERIFGNGTCEETPHQPESLTAEAPVESAFMTSYMTDDAPEDHTLYDSDGLAITLGTFEQCRGTASAIENREVIFTLSNPGTWTSRSYKIVRA